MVKLQSSASSSATHWSKAYWVKARKLTVLQWSCTAHLLKLAYSWNSSSCPGRPFRNKIVNQLEFYYSLASVFKQIYSKMAVSNLSESVAGVTCSVRGWEFEGMHIVKCTIPEVFAACKVVVWIPVYACLLIAVARDIWHLIENGVQSRTIAFTMFLRVVKLHRVSPIFVTSCT